MERPSRGLLIFFSSWVELQIPAQKSLSRTALCFSPAAFSKFCCLSHMPSRLNVKVDEGSRLHSGLIEAAIGDWVHHPSRNGQKTVQWRFLRNFAPIQGEF